MDGSELTIDKISIEIESKATDTTEAITKLTASIDKLEKSLGSIASVSAKIDQLGQSLSNVTKNNKKLKDFNDIFVAMMSKVKTGAIVASLGGITKKIGGYVNESNNYIENLNLFYVSMGKMADEAKKFAENFSSVLGVDVSNVMRYIGDFNSLAKTFGIASDKAYIMAKNLTQLAYDISSFRNIDLEQSMQKIRSGFVGEIEPMRAIGIALDQATLQETAYSLGINKRIATMTRAQKTELLYYQMITKTTQLQGDMARTLIQPANAIRVMKQQFTLLARAIGNIFIPIVMKTIPYVMALTQALTELAQKIANFLGFEIDTSAWENLQDISYGIEDIGDSAAGTTKELKKMLAPFDELNVIDFGKASGGGAGLDLDGGTLGIPLPEYDALAGAVTQNLSKAREQLKKIKPLVETIIGIILGLKGFSLIAKIGKFADGLKLTETALKGIKGKLAGATTALEIFIGVFAGFKIGKFLDNIFEGFTGIEGLGSSLIFIAGGILALFNPILGISIAVGAGIANITNAFKPAIKSFDVFSKVSDETRQKLEPLYDNLNKVDKKIKELNWKQLAPTKEDIDEIKTNLTSATSAIYKELKGDVDKAVEQIHKMYEAGKITETERDRMIKALEDTYDKQVSSVKEREERITAIIEKAKNENRKLTDEEVKEISKSYNEILKTGVTTMSKNKQEQEVLLRQMKNNAVALTAEEASEVVKQAIKEKDERIAKAKETRDELYLQADAIRRSGIENAEEKAREIERLADEQYKVETEDAENTYRDIIKTMNENIPTIMGLIDTQTGDMKTKFQTWLDDIGGVIAPYIEKFKETWNNMFWAIELAWNTFARAFGWKEIKLTFDDFKKEGTKAATEIGQSMGNAISTNTKFNSSSLRESFNKNMSNAIADINKNNPTLFGSNGLVANRIVFNKIPTREDGGPVDQGQLFIAREAGPELVGNIGRKTVVANNDQIIEGIAQGVKFGVAEAMGTDTRQPIYVYVGNDKVYSGYGSYANSENNMYGSNVIRV